MSVRSVPSSIGVKALGGFGLKVTQSFLFGIFLGLTISGLFIASIGMGCLVFKEKVTWKKVKNLSSVITGLSKYIKMKGE
jgi:hypothetical protein